MTENQDWSAEREPQKRLPHLRNSMGDPIGAVWEKIEKTVQETLVCLDKNRLSEKDEFEARHMYC